MYPFSGQIPTRPQRHATITRNNVPRKRASFSISSLIEAACAVNGVDVDQVKRDGRKRELPVAWAVEHIAVLSSPYSHEQIGRALRRDQSCISYAKRRAAARMSDPEYARRLNEIKRRVGCGT